MSTLLVTGASGFIGAAVVKALRALPTSQALILAGRSPQAQADAAGVRHTRLDLTDMRLELEGRVEAVIHLAGEKRDETRMDAVNHLGAVRLVDAAARAGAKRFVHLSSVGVIGAPKHAGLIDASSVRTPRNAYEVSKNAGELAVRERCDSLGMACVVLQPSNVVGVVPGRSYPLLGMARTVQRGWFRQFGRRDAWVNYVAVDDVAAAVVAAAHGVARSGVFIVNTPAPLSALVKWVAEELGVHAPEKHLPLWFGACAGAAGALGRALLHREMPMSPERFGELTNTTRYDGSALAQAFEGMYPVGIEAALRHMVRQYRREGLV